VNTHSTLSSRIWGLDWGCHLPWTLGNVTVTVGHFADALAFVGDHYAEIFGDGKESGFLSDPFTEAKRRFGDEMDVFSIRADGQVVGLLIAHPLDWTTYYMRSVAILPAYRDRKLFNQIVERCFAPLASAGVERIEGETAPTNVVMMRALTGLGFLVTSTANSERWGATVRFTKFLREEAASLFAEKFCRTPPVRGQAAPFSSALERSPP
jgi:ribosomal protein S18 acetylase RimI-like enzyme